MRWLLPSTQLLLCLTLAGADAPPKSVPNELPRVPPRTPGESAQAFEVHPGFRIELVAPEPAVQSPVAAEFDEDGRLFVVELPEYNQDGSKTPHGSGRVVMLEDVNGDGKFDKRTVVVDQLDYPTALFPWDGGLFIGAAPHLIYWKGNQRKVVLTGFGVDKAGEGQINSFRWGLDNRIHISTGLDGGELMRIGVKEEVKPVSVRRLNLLYDPRSGDFETTSGGGQHGMTLDDWGNTFVCGNSDPCQHLVYDTRYLARNAAVQAPPPLLNIAPGGKFTKLHRISQVEPWRALRTRLRKEGVVPGSDEGGQPSGFFTGASGITVYRGDAYPEALRGDVFVGEVANNLVYRAKLVPKGPSFVAERADQEREFVASKDIWFRPVQFLQGPDGCLYIIDMYRELIEGAAFLSPEVLKFVDPAAGVNMGRIWRIVPKDFKRPQSPKLRGAATKDLVSLLDSANGWHRDTAARLLYQRQDATAIEPLRQLAAEAKSPQGRMHALSALEGLGALTRKDVAPRLADADAHVRAHAIRLAERQRIAFTYQAFKALSRDDDAMVRCQLVWSLWRDDNELVADTLREIIKRDIADPWVRLAVLCTGTGNDESRGVLDFIEDPALRQTAHGRAFIESLVETAGARNRAAAGAALRGISRLREQDVGFQLHLLGVLCRRTSPDNVRYFQRTPHFRDLLDQLSERARDLAADSKANDKDRAAAIGALRFQPFQDSRDVFTMALKPSQPHTVQVAALELLGAVGSSEAPDLLLKAWPSLSPAVRATATEVFLSRPNWVTAFLDAVEKKQIARADIDPARIALLRKSPSRAVRIRVDDLFAGSGPGKRKDVLAQYQKALTLKGDPLKGKAVFKTNCSACHKLDGVGEEVGADLKAIRDRGAENIMLNILDPNREVKPQYMAYQLETTSGKSFSGMLTAETPNSVTIRLLDGRSETVRRGDIESLRSTGLSFMPEGLEKQVDMQAMADLLAYLSSIGR
jgi:putative membrane-bound dehydrogenase-like protein